jgi:hypothetical protein
MNQNEENDPNNEKITEEFSFYSDDSFEYEKINLNI